MIGLSARSAALLGALSISALGVGCQTDKDDAEQMGGGPDADARLLTDVYSWECIDYEAEDPYYKGVFAQVISLQFAPDALPSMRLPSPGGCTAQLNMFPENAGSLGTAIPDLSGDVRWETDVDDGVFSERSAGFYKDDVFEDNRTCNSINNVLLGGTRLVNAGALDGVGTPNPEDIPSVDFSGLSYNDSTGVQTIEWGDAVTASWEAHDWDQVWVQVRREREGVAWESVTCNATGLDSFSLGDDVWGQLDETLDVEQNQLYVGFQRSEEVITADGYKVEATIRAMAVALVQD